MRKVSVISLGCPKNTVDSEKMLGILGSSGYAISSIPEESDFVIVNTCAFIEPAVKEAKQMIANLKKNKNRYGYKLIVTGCLPARDNRLLDIRDIDGVIGPYDIDNLVDILSDIDAGRKINVKSCLRITNYCRIPRVISTLPYAYLKITEGCSNHCSYCTIPSIRGPLFSFPEKEILKEAESLFDSGVKELIIVGHDITAYGKDRGRGNLCNLLRKILKIGFQWIRLMYLHPSGITEELLELINDNASMCKYLDIPLQHVNPRILKKMNRPVFDYKKLIEDIRRAVPRVAIRTTFIVGFPGETEEIFEQLIDFVRTFKFERMGSFIYYPEKNTKAFFLKKQIPFEIKKKRFFELMNVQKTISKDLSRSFVGKEIDVLVEKNGNGCLEGRTEMDAPDIDWTAKIYGRASIGDTVRIKIIKSSPYCLKGTIIRRK
ncbi:MAG: 30S ribosomal protein S12 methylthiotransferase RimO [Candidatus Omnitrophica bacterium]|nr:30S ribosomal protein S12 methylthiotransferase RimO [Candidatus Omnitrophota bacterium]MCM8827767.1 30S ribosomal protein S12 methylthiotransferase RimO [Candidatus Omnitrophota bacterium]